MTKMHLRAHVPNEGARRLAHFLGHGGEHALDHLAVAIQRHVSFIDRLLSGELTPGSTMAHQLWLATDGNVWRKDWYRDAEGGWFDAVTKRELDRRAA